MRGKGEKNKKMSLDAPHSMRLANGCDLTALASVSSSRPPNLEFVAASNLFPDFVSVYLHVMTCPCDYCEK